ncbi:hypothetical protein QQP08_005719 [Theobroma cacao]|nr:hypothetical protein QQP08_005719 [Theobroma cacao]
MGSEIPQVHMFFFPLMAHGHMIPTVDMAKVFATRGVKTTIVTTPLNASFFTKTIERSKESGIDIGIKILKFPAVEAGLPEGCENADLIPTSQDESGDMLGKFFKATFMLQEPLEQLLQECKPDCLVADMFFPWATDAANKFGIPRLVFHGTSFFSLCASESMRLYEPHKKVQSDSEPFVVPNLPGDIKLTKKQLPDYMKQDAETDFTKMVKASKESELRSYGVVVNSFYELEDTYADCYRNILGRKAWHIGPVSLCNRATEDKAERGKKSAIDEHECLKWLDSKEPNSVVYICFGSMANFTSAQLKEIAMALEASEQQFIWVVHIFFFPIMAQGHVIPTVDMAKLFATRGVKTTIITTPANASFFSKTIQRSKESGLDVDVKILKYSTEEAGLPEGCENADLLPTSRDEPKDIVSKFFKAKVMLQEPLERLLQECKPDCLVAHMFFPWATDAADKFGIPRLVFYGVSVFSTCAMECMTLYEPHKHVESEFEQFVVPNLPGDIKLSKKQLPDYVKESVETDFTKMLKASKESELRSYGVIFNSFYELEDMYADYYKNVLGRKAWHIGPVSLCNRAIEDKAERGKKSAVDEHECSKWLDSRKPNSVVYVCFGSMANFNSAQLKEIAMGLETSGQQFIWVIGVAVGVQQWVSTVGDFVKREAIEKAVKKIMNGKTAEELRNKAKALAEMAKGAVAKGGSSYSELNALIEELKLRRH